MHPNPPGPAPDVHPASPTAGPRPATTSAKPSNAAARSQHYNNPDDKEQAYTLADGPRRPGAPDRRAAVEIAENASWADVPWQATNPLVVKEEEMGRASRIVLQHDLARGAIQRVSRWEYLTGITDAEREQMRAERLARGEPPHLA